MNHITHQLAAGDFQLYAATINLDSLKSLVIRLLGTALVIVLAVRIFNAYAKRQWGEIIGEIVVAAVAIFFVASPDTAVGVLKDIVNGIFA